MTKYEVVFKKTIRIAYRITAESEEEAASTNELDCGKADWVETINSELDNVSEER